MIFEMAYYVLHKENKINLKIDLIQASKIYCTEKLFIAIYVLFYNDNFKKY